MSEIDGPSVGKTPPDVSDVEPKHDCVRFLASGCPRDLDFRFVDITAHNFPDPMKFELLVRSNFLPACIYPQSRLSRSLIEACHQQGDLIHDYMKNGVGSGAAEDGVPLASQDVAKVWRLRGLTIARAWYTPIPCAARARTTTRF